ncbi:MAG TPA: hypothetical protein P5511_07100, partial [Candidatus Goldiibacteriota bacterium]|nr:hypothetical protein [Candidatus Goldiibacteriota bacterium]
ALRKEFEEKQRQKDEELRKKLETLKKVEDSIKPAAVNPAVAKEKLKEELEAKQKKEEKNMQKQVVDSIKKSKEEEERVKKEREAALREKMKQQIHDEMEKEKEQRKKELLQKMEAVKKESEEMHEKLSEIKLSHEEKVMLVSMLEDSLNIVAVYYMARTGKVKADVIRLYVRSLVDAARKDPEYIRKALLDTDGEQRKDGTFDRIKLITLANNVSFDETKRAEKLCKVLRLIFDERLMTIEDAHNTEVKNRIMQDFRMNISKVTANPKYSKRVAALFTNYVVPQAKK